MSTPFRIVVKGYRWFYVCGKKELGVLIPRGPDVEQLVDGKWIYVNTFADIGLANKFLEKQIS